MWRGPFAYGQATATRIFLRVGGRLTRANDKESSAETCTRTRRRPPQDEDRADADRAEKGSENEAPQASDRLPAMRGGPGRRGGRVAARRVAVRSSRLVPRHRRGGLGATRGVGCVELRDRDSARRCCGRQSSTPGLWWDARVAGCVSRLDATRMRTPRREPRVSRTGSAVSCRRERAPAREPALDADTVIVDPGTADDASEGSACAPLASTTAAGVGCGAVGAGAAEPLGKSTARRGCLRRLRSGRGRRGCRWRVGGPAAEAGSRDPRNRRRSRA
jgi:hypothetical protein